MRILKNLSLINQVFSHQIIKFKILFKALIKLKTDMMINK